MWTIKRKETRCAGGFDAGNSTQLLDSVFASVKLQLGGYVIGDTESPIVPILTGDEARTIALWQNLLAERFKIDHVTLQPSWPEPPRFGDRRVIPISGRPSTSP